MRPLRYSINVTLDGCCDHRGILPDEDLHRHAVENLNRADALLFGRVTYEMMEAAFRPAWTGEMPDWMEPFRRDLRSSGPGLAVSGLHHPGKLDGGVPAGGECEGVGKLLSPLAHGRDLTLRCPVR